MSLRDVDGAAPRRDRSSCPAPVGDNRQCGETQTLEIVREFRQLYESKMKQFDSEAAGGDCLRGLQAKLDLQQEWIRDLTEQNEMLVRTVEELELEATDRVAMLEEKLRLSAKSGYEVMQKYRDFSFSINLDETFQKLVYLQNDVRNLLEFIRRVRDEHSWSIDGLQFYNVSSEDLFGPLITCWAIEGNQSQQARHTKISGLAEEKERNLKELEDKLKQAVAEKDELYEKLNNKTNELGALKRSMLDMRNALTIEVAEKHDIILGLRRDVQQLEEQCRQSNKQTQFKDDILKEMRKELKALKAQKSIQSEEEAIGLKSAMSKLKEESEAQKEQLQVAKQKISDYAAEEDNHKRRQSTASERVDTLTEHLDKAKKECAEKDKELEDLKKQIQAYLEKIKQLEDELEKSKMEAQKVPVKSSSREAWTATDIIEEPDISPNGKFKGKAWPDGTLPVSKTRVEDGESIRLPKFMTGQMPSDVNGLHEASQPKASQTWTDGATPENKIRVEDGQSMRSPLYEDSQPKQSKTWYDGATPGTKTGVEDERSTQTPSFVGQIPGSISGEYQASQSKQSQTWSDGVIPGSKTSVEGGRSAQPPSFVGQIPGSINGEQEASQLKQSKTWTDGLALGSKNRVDESGQSMSLPSFTSQMPSEVRPAISYPEQPQAWTDETSPGSKGGIGHTPTDVSGQDVSHHKPSATKQLEGALQGTKSEIEYSQHSKLPSSSEAWVTTDTSTGRGTSQKELKDQSLLATVSQAEEGLQTSLSGTAGSPYTKSRSTSKEWITTDTSAQRDDLLPKKSQRLGETTLPGSKSGDSRLSKSKSSDATWVTTDMSIDFEKDKDEALQKKLKQQELMQKGSKSEGEEDSHATPSRSSTTAWNTTDTSAEQSDSISDYKKVRIHTSSKGSDQETIELKDAVSSVSMAYKDREIERAKHNQEVSNLKQTIVELEKALRNSQTRSDSLQKAECMCGLQGDMTRLRIEFQKQVQTDASLKQEYMQIKTQFFAMEKVAVEAKEIQKLLQKANEDLQHQLELLNQQLLRETHMNGLSRERIDELQRMLHEKTFELNRYEEQYKNMQGRLDVTLRENGDLKSQLLSKLQSYEQNCMCEGRGMEYRQKESAAPKDNFRELKEKLATMKGLLQQKNEQYNKLEMDFRVQTCTVACLKQHIEGTKLHYENDVADLKRTIQELNEKLTKAEESYRYLHEDYKRSQAQVIEITQHEGKLQQDHLKKERESTQKLQTLKNEQVRLCECVAQLETESSILRNELMKKDRQMNITQQNMCGLKNEINKLLQRHNKLKTENEKLQAQIAQLQESTMKQTQQNQQLNQYVDEIEAAQADKERLEARNNHLRKELQMLQTAYKELEQKFQQLNEQLKNKCCKCKAKSDRQRGGGGFTEEQLRNNQWMLWSSGSYRSDSVSPNSSTSTNQDWYTYDEYDDIEYTDDGSLLSHCLKRVESINQELQKSNQFWQTKMVENDYLVTKDE